MADDKMRDAWTKSEKVLAKGNAEESLKILREIDPDGENATTLRIAGEATWAMASSSSSKSEYRRAASLLRDAVKMSPRDKKANTSYNSILNEMQDKRIKETTIPRLVNEGTPTLAGIIALFATIILVLFVVKAASTSNTSLATEATLELSWTNSDGTQSSGVVVVELYDDDAPIHVENFGILAENGDYDGTVFHRIISNFMMQGGDFTNGDGSGGYAGKFFGYCDGQEADSASDCTMSSYTVPDEADNGRTHAPYALSMAKTNNPHTGGSQFFIVDPDAVGQDGSPGTPHLDGVHTVFGEVTSGFEHIDTITALCETQNCQNDKTPQDVVLESVTTNMEDDSWWKFW
jgi:peptidyl-prolyl cis-trans isomerase B (cyclophilin B)